MTWYKIRGEHRGFVQWPSIVIDHDMEKEQAEDMLTELRSEMPLWNFRIEEQEFVDAEVQESVCSKP